MTKRENDIADQASLASPGLPALLSIIERLEMATGPDRELDIAIMLIRLTPKHTIGSGK